MLISGKDIQTIREYVEKLDTPELRERYLAQDYARADRTKNVELRYRWDIWYAVPSWVRYPLYDRYPTLTDAHIDTMLRRVVRPLVEGDTK